MVKLRFFLPVFNHFGNERMPLGTSRKQIGRLHEVKFDRFAHVFFTTASSSQLAQVIPPQTPTLNAAKAPQFHKYLPNIPSNYMEEIAPQT